eukprot:6410462-Alexandrium_andersonii.AAC.1
MRSFCVALAEAGPPACLPQESLDALAVLKLATCVDGSELSDAWEEHRDAMLKITTMAGDTAYSGVLSGLLGNKKALQCIGDVVAQAEERIEKAAK